MGIGWMGVSKRERNNQRTRAIRAQMAHCRNIVGTSAVPDLLRFLRRKIVLPTAVFPRAWQVLRPYSRRKRSASELLTRHSLLLAA